MSRLSKLAKKALSFWHSLGQDDRAKYDGTQPVDVPGIPGSERYLFHSDPNRFPSPYMGDGSGQAYPTANVSYAPDPVMLAGNSAPAYESKTTTSTVAAIAVKPKDVLHELGRRPKLGDLVDLQQKIELMKIKAEIIQHRFAKEEVEAMLGFLENRKKYNTVFTMNGRNISFREFFSLFDATDRAKVEALCEKHGLVFKPADIFVPEMPDEATLVMRDYRYAVEQITGKLPPLFVIATKESFKKSWEKNDPILLAQSPFGFYYYILGAWDAEMLLLSEL